MIEYFAENLWQFWAIICMICLIIELTSGDFFLMCFAIGAFVTALTNIFGLGFYAQLLVFAVVSVLCIFFVRPFALKYLHRGENRPSNAEALIGRIGRVSTEIPAGGSGRVAIDGDDWKAVAADGRLIQVGEKVMVESMDSIILTVKRI